MGTVHHLAWHTEDDVHQLNWHHSLLQYGNDVTPVKNHHDFRSVSFHEPDSVLFEMVTDPPGFSVDEPVEQLGTPLKLPRWREPHRSPIERTVPRLQVPEEHAGSDQIGERAWSICI